MKNPSKILLVVCLLAFGSTAPVLRAENNAASEGKKERAEGKKEHPKGNPGERMKKELGLTDAQAEQMKAIHEASREQLKAIKENEALSLEEKKTAAKKLHEATKAKVDALLSPEQKAKFDKMREGMKEHMKERRGDKDGPEGPGEKGGKGEKGEKHGNRGVQ
jgi:Spy/CpxP family protein refolding chaperone